MKTVKEDRQKRIIKGQEKVKFSSYSSFHLIAITARVKGEKQLGNSATDDEDLTVYIDDKTFPKLGSNRLIDSPAAFNGGKLHNLTKTVYFITYLQGKNHQLLLNADNPPGTATFESVEVDTLDSTGTLTLEPKIQAEDGDRREWITFVLDGFSLNSFTVVLGLKRRLIDSDDVKVIIDGRIQRNFRSIFHKYWYFIGSLLTGETQSATFTPNLEPGLHYIEFWADRMPVFNSIEIKLRKKITNKDNIKQYQDTKFSRDYNKLDEFIVKATNFWNNFFLTQMYPPPELLDPNLVKAIVYRESRLGYVPNGNIIDVMQVWNPKDPARQTLLGETPEREFISSDKIEFIHKFYPIGVTPKEETREESIFWGIRWLYHKTQYLLENDDGIVSIPYIRKWRSWKEAAGSYNANPELVEGYVKEVFSVYDKGVDSEDNILW